MLVVAETLRHGTSAGARVALAPVLTDGPLLIGSAAFAYAIAGMDVALGVLGLVGAGFLIWLAIDAFRTRPVEVDTDKPPGSLWKAIATNLLNPHPYVFWVGVGGPLVAQAWEAGLPSVGAFLVAFFGGLCGSKLVLALLVGKARGVLTGKVYLWTVRATGLVMLAFAAWFVVDALGRLV